MVKPKIYIFNLWHTINNYGAMLTAYALQQVLQTLGYDSELAANQGHQSRRKLSKFNFCPNFRKKYLKISSCIDGYKELLNTDASIYITGSDQVFRLPYLNNKTGEYFLDFVPPDSKKIAFSASFGIDKETFLNEYSKDVIEDMRNSLKSFDYISVRENAGVEICRDIMGINADWIIDPVFILDKTFYENMIKEADIDFSGKIVSYVLDTNKHDKNIYKQLERKYNLPVKTLADTNISVENWLAAIKNCEILITDSFHGMCFAIIFNKPFICIKNKNRGGARFDSILEMLGIEDKCIISIDEILRKDCIFKIDYAKVNERIAQESENALEKLNEILKTAPDPDNYNTKLSARMHFLEQELYKSENTIQELKRKATLKYKIKKIIWKIWLGICKFMPAPVQKYSLNLKNRINQWIK